VEHSAGKLHSRAAARASHILSLMHLIIPTPKSTSLSPKRKRKAPLGAHRRSTPQRGSVQFAAILCEISGSFLIFPSAWCDRNHTQRSAFSIWLRGLDIPSAPTPREVTAAPLGSSHEDRETYRSPRSERRVSAFRRGGDYNHADRELDLDDPVLSSSRSSATGKKKATQLVALVIGAMQENTASLRTRFIIPS